jgi:hypothetical protein
LNILRLSSRYGFRTRPENSMSQAGPTFDSNSRSRRQFVKALLVGASLATVTRGLPARLVAAGVKTASDPWVRLPQILKRIRPPVLQNREFDIRNFLNPA